MEISATKQSGYHGRERYWKKEQTFYQECSKLCCKIREFSKANDLSHTAFEKKLDLNIKYFRICQDTLNFNPQIYCNTSEWKMLWFNGLSLPVWNLLYTNYYAITVEGIQSSTRIYDNILWINHTNTKSYQLLDQKIVNLILSNFEQIQHIQNHRWEKMHISLLVLTSSEDYDTL